MAGVRPGESAHDTDTQAEGRAVDDRYASDLLLALRLDATDMYRKERHLAGRNHFNARGLDDDRCWQHNGLPCCKWSKLSASGIDLRRCDDRGTDGKRRQSDRGDHES